MIVETAYDPGMFETGQFSGQSAMLLLGERVLVSLAGSGKRRVAVNAVPLLILNVREKLETVLHHKVAPLKNPPPSRDRLHGRAIAGVRIATAGIPPDGQSTLEFFVSPGVAATAHPLGNEEIKCCIYIRNFTGP